MPRCGKTRRTGVSMSACSCSRSPTGCARRRSIRSWPRCIRRQKTHYLNILHAGWPGGMILGGLLAYCFCGAKRADRPAALGNPDGLVPGSDVCFTASIVDQREIPDLRSAGRRRWVFGTMLLEFASPMLLFLFVLHGDGRLRRAGDRQLDHEHHEQRDRTGNAFLLFVYMSALMFVLRFFAGPIVERINPIGLLFVGVVLGVPSACTALGYAGAAALVSYRRERSTAWAKRFSGRPCWASSASGSPKAAR